MREFTIRAIILGIVLSIILGAANVYLGLYAGMTVSASIPAAVISMALLRALFHNTTVLENNIVQSMASAGESLAAGVIFTVPALLLVGIWKNFEFWPTTLIAITGGVLGVVFMIPLRRVMMNRPDLKYPEGVACAEVLTAGDRGAESINAIATGASLGAIFKGLTTGWNILKGTVEGAIFSGRSVFYFGTDLSPALLGVGFIVRLEIAVLIFMGGVIGWVFAMPIFGYFSDTVTSQNALSAAWGMWSAKTRFLGVGAMIVGGIYSIFRVRSGIVEGIRTVSKRDVETSRTDRDMGLGLLAGFFLLAVFGTFILYDSLLHSYSFAIVTTIVMVIASGLFVAVAANITGLVGSSNSPVSGMTICALLMASGVVLATGIRGDSAVLAILGVAGVVCCATCTSGDIAQDLKTGQIVGASPRRQQMAEIIGVLVAAFMLAPVLSILNDAYGIGTDRPGALKAPQAVLFASLARGLVDSGDIPWNMVMIGAAIGVILIVINFFLERSKTAFRTHVMPVAVGIYLPLSLSVPIFCGGLLRYLLSRKSDDEKGPGVLFASGLIAGEALMGIFLAVAITTGLKQEMLSVLLFLILALFFYRTAIKKS